MDTKNVNRKNILEKAVNTFGTDSQIDKTIEEMAELTKALLKLRFFYRNKSASNKKDVLLCDVAEEIADVKIMIEQLEIIFGRYISLIDNFYDAKIKRLECYIENKDK